MMAGIATTFPFPHPVLTPITDRPTTDEVNLLKRQVLANLLAITSDIGGGAHGHAWLGMDDAAFTAMTGVAPVVPVHPGPLPVYANGATGATPVMAVKAASSIPNQVCPCAPPPMSLVMANKLASTCRLSRLTSSVRLCVWKLCWHYIMCCCIM